MELTLRFPEPTYCDRMRSTRQETATSMHATQMEMGSSYRSLLQNDGV